MWLFLKYIHTYIQLPQKYDNLGVFRCVLTLNVKGNED